MGWFGRKAAGAPPRPALLRALWSLDAADGAPRSYEAQVRAAYVGNPIAQRAVRIVAEAIASVTIDVGGDVEDGAAPALLAPPLLEAVATYLLLHGNAFVQIAEGHDGMPAALFALRPDRVKVELDGAGWPNAYVYRAGEALARIPAQDAAGRPCLIHLRAMHPLDDHYGLGCLGAASGAVAAHNRAAEWNRALLDRGARPSGALVYDPGDGSVLSPVQFDRLRDELDTHMSGAANAGRPLLLDGGLSWQPMGLTPAEMDFARFRDAAAREIALAFGVPPMLLGLPGDNTYANYREAVRALWRLTVLPMADRMLRGIGDALAAWWPGLTLAVDVDQISALHTDRAELWAGLAAADFLSGDEKRAMLGFPPASA